MSYTVRALLLSALACGSWSAAHAQSNELAGSWTAWVCPPGAQPETGRCSSFVLSLYQKNERVCGSHVFATAGAKSMDEGGAPSVLGTVSASGANVTIESGRSGVRIPAELKPAGKGSLQFRRLESPSADYLIPPAAQLARSRHGTLFSPVFEQRLQATCSTHLNAPVNPAPSPIPRTTQ